ncbi:MAG: hypothetical protein IT379_34205 [Deltaproteobacteria bacterium]|nr:hypothetical protein [Deltaproteobacteria bacterium]
MATLVVAAVVAFLGYRFARAFVPDGVARAFIKAVVWVGGPAAYVATIALGPREWRAALVAIGLAVGLAFFVVDRRRATALERDAEAKARQQAMRQQRKRLPPPAPPPTTRGPP